MAALLVFGTSNAMAGGPTGIIDSEINAKACALDGGIDGTYNGITGGGGLAFGKIHGDADGVVFGGNISSWMGGSAGALIDGYSFDYFNFGCNSIEHVLGSETSSHAQTSFDGGMDVDPSLWSLGGFGDMDFCGIALQATGNFTVMGPAPIFQADGYTAGLAVQGSLGLISGDLDLGAGPDFYTGWCNPRYNDQYAEGQIGAGVFMDGFSMDKAYRGVIYEGDAFTEYMGHVSVAETEVESYGYDWNRDGAGTWSDWSYSDVDGGYAAAGLAANKTKMVNQGGVGEATAAALYFGCGELGTNFSGQAVSTTHVQITKVRGMKGSIVNTSATASATATNYTSCRD